ncbi:Pyridinium-3,5-biscarboxylic acid mononucleotide synthase [Geodia barretti]|uniref:phosphoribosylaminoimidazole carboxylase n=1 Tax=Geodia barretti TaxID=519541 RepID=A0AA35RXE0_GEOBA|nr:Pyridinium-3,5-biscarboxylic acid mononucleotide synthase [Geodia barretti]
MTTSELRRRLEELRRGDLSVDDLLKYLRDYPYEDLDFAKIDHHRPLRTGFPEVVLGRGKSPQQIASIVQSLAGRGSPVLVTKADQESFNAVAGVMPAAIYHSLAGAIEVPGENPLTVREGVTVVTGGTADLPVAEEAALTARLMGSPPERINDVGVAGLHRLLASMDRLREARVIVVVAGMEAALASVVAGLVSAPVVAVPTSVGYGASYEGLSALLGMLNSCAPGVATVNIDNGFGAGYLAAQINKMGK